MTRKTQQDATDKAADRKARLAAALKSNMARRKAQARARRAPNASEAETRAGKDTKDG